MLQGRSHDGIRYWPNGICFSPDYKKLYVADTGSPRDLKVWDVRDQTTLGRGRQFADMKLGDVSVGPDGIRADIDGNIWAAAGWAGRCSAGT